MSAADLFNLLGIGGVAIGFAFRDVLQNLLAGILILLTVRGRTVRCELDGTRTYDRCAGVCYLDGADISEVMVHRGLARDCPRYSQGRYAEAEGQAAAEGATIRRIYALPGYCRPR